MRDNFKSEEYYKKLYEQDTRFLEFNESTLKNVIEEKGENFETIPSCYHGIANKCYHRLYLGYTMGKTYRELLPDARKYIENGIESCTGSPYGVLESIIFVAIVFNLQEYKDAIKETMIKYKDYRDKYMEEIYQLLDPEFVITSEVFYWEKECKSIDEIISISKTDKDAGIKALKKYVDKQWFKTLNDGMIRKGDPSYRGFWCIEAAALVKALKLDDSELKDSKYYPYDMAHFCDRIS